MLFLHGRVFVHNFWMIFRRRITFLPYEVLVDEVKLKFSTIGKFLDGHDLGQLVIEWGFVLSEII